MTIECHKMKTTDLLFFLAFGVFVVFGILEMTLYARYIDVIYSLVKVACVALLIIREFSASRYNVRTFIIAIVFIILMALGRLETSLSSVIYILIFLYCARDINIKTLAHFAAWITLITMAVVVASSFLGIIENHEFYFASQDQLRYGLGFRYTLYGPTLMFNTTALFIYVKKNDIQWISLLILSIINAWFFVMTLSKLAFGLSIGLILVAAFMKIRPLFFEKKRILCYLMIGSFIICMMISLLLTLLYNSNVPWWQQLDTLLEGRLSLGKDSLEENGVTLFGQDIAFVGNGLDSYGQADTGVYNYVDSLYIKVLQRYGIVFFILWIGLMTFTLYRCYKVKDHWMMICLTFIAFQCILDDLAWEFFVNTFWFATVIVLKGPRNREQELVAIQDVTEPELPGNYP